MGPLIVSPMGFGTWAWGNQLLWGYQESMDTDLQRTFNLAVENGINLFDTADSYGTGRLNGQSEKLLGRFVREFEGQKRVRDNILIATKFAAYPWRLTPGQFVTACKSSLDRMQIEQIGIGQLHWSTANYAPLQELALWDGLVAMYEKGLVRAVGVSNYGPKQLVKIHDYLKARGVPLCSAQGPVIQTNSSRIGAFIEFTKRNCAKKAQNYTTTHVLGPERGGRVRGLGHTRGSKSFACYREDMTTEDYEPTEIDLFMKTHAKKNGKVTEILILAATLQADAKRVGLEQADAILGRKANVGGANNVKEIKATRSTENKTENEESMNFTIDYPKPIRGDYPP
ncbi:hypothetical protein L1049_016483 [Liquidambar formosana]|uniref:NADP-dependent oxidoreductase domain-containing protein n=1 Tax=Liquidambar formosana TaxID=63359 RepID=A0AAP0X6V6_LIQFO